MTDGVDEDDGDEDARDKKLTSFSSCRRCYQSTPPPGIKRKNYDKKHSGRTNKKTDKVR